LSPPPKPPLATPTPLPPAPSPDAAATLEPSAAQGDAPSALDPSGSVPPVAAPTPRPAVTAPVAPAEPTLADARTLLRQGRLGEAANGFVTNLRQTPAGSFSIQLLVACSSDTVEKALANVAAPDLYILPVNYKGRPCYRICWGLYDNETRADSAVRTLPEYFRKGGASPRVVPTSGLLP
jgi:septal ring-binding cell division protein DamX